MKTPLDFPEAFLFASCLDETAAKLFRARKLDRLAGNEGQARRHVCILARAAAIENGLFQAACAFEAHIDEAGVRDAGILKIGACEARSIQDGVVELGIAQDRAFERRACEVRA